MSDSFGFVMIDFDCFIMFDFFGPIMPDRDRLIVPYLFRPIVPNIHPLVVLDLLLLIVLRVNINQLRPLGIVQRDFVEPAAALRAVRLDRR